VCDNHVTAHTEGMCSESSFCILHVFSLPNPRQMPRMNPLQPKSFHTHRQLLTFSSPNMELFAMDVDFVSVNSRLHVLNKIIILLLLQD